ncbi:MAG TPA: DNA cytosine methyltransferase, partial [Gemmatimonadales bacterium]|nr:DNA cytosine methyltransferase [Gemmatimonadales bacterium]
TGRGTPLVAEPFTLAIRGRLDSRDLESRQDGTANAIVTPNGGRDGIGIGAIAYGVHGEHSSAMTSDGIAEVAYRTDRARALDTSGGYATNQGGTVALAFTTKDHGADAGELAPTLRAGGHTGSHANGGVMPAIAFDTTQITSPLNYSAPKPGDPCHPLASSAHVPAVAFEPRYYTRDNKTGGAPGDVAVLKADASKRGDSAPHVAYAIQGGATRENPECGPDGAGVREDDCAYTIEARSEVQAVGFADVADPLAANQAKTWTREGSRNFRMSNVATAPYGAGYRMQVRRLTPRECERLQGFPDDYTLIPYRNKPAADGPRYKALGNSMAVPVMAWIGRRIQLVEDLP